MIRTFLWFAAGVCIGLIISVLVTAGHPGAALVVFLLALAFDLAYMITRRPHRG